MKKSRRVVRQIQIFVTVFVLFFGSFSVFSLDVQAKTFERPIVAFYSNQEPFSSSSFSWKSSHTAIFANDYGIFDSSGFLFVGYLDENGFCQPFLKDVSYDFDFSITFSNFKYSASPAFVPDGAGFYQFKKYIVVDSGQQIDAVGVPSGFSGYFSGGTFDFSSVGVVPNENGFLQFYIRTNVAGSLPKNGVTYTVSCSYDVSILGSVKFQVDRTDNEILDSIESGYENGDMGSSGDALDSSLSGMDEAENNLFSSAKTDLDSYEFVDVSTNVAVMSAVSFVTTFLQSFWTSSGGLDGFGVITSVGFSVLIVSIVIGLFRHYKK